MFITTLTFVQKQFKESKTGRKIYIHLKISEHPTISYTDKKVFSNTYTTQGSFANEEYFTSNFLKIKKTIL